MLDEERLVEVPRVEELIDDEIAREPPQRKERVIASAQRMFEREVQKLVLQGPASCLRSERLEALSDLEVRGVALTSDRETRDEFACCARADRPNEEMTEIRLGDQKLA